MSIVVFSCSEQELTPAQKEALRKKGINVPRIKSDKDTTTIDKPLSKPDGAKSLSGKNPRLSAPTTTPRTYGNTSSTTRRVPSRSVTPTRNIDDLIYKDQSTGQEFDLTGAVHFILWSYRQQYVADSQFGEVLAQNDEFNEMFNAKTSPEIVKRIIFQKVVDNLGYIQRNYKFHYDRASKIKNDTLVPGKEYNLLTKKKK